MATEKQVSLHCVAAVGLWTGSFMLILAGTIVAVSVAGSDVARSLGVALMAHGLVCSAGAATYTIRNMFHRQNRLLREAFRLGQERAGENVQRFKGT